MKLLLNDEEIDISSTVIEDKVRKETQKQIEKYSAFDLPKRLFIKGAVRTGIALIEQFSKLEIPLPDTPAYREDFIIALLTDIPQIAAELSSHITIKIRGVSDLATHKQTINEVNLEFTQ